MNETLTEFAQTLKEAIPDARIVVTENTIGGIESAKLNIDTQIDNTQMDVIDDEAFRENLSYIIKRSGKGLVITFKAQ